MRLSSLVVFVVPALAFGCASPTGTPPPTLQPTVAEPGPTATDEPFRSYFRGTGPPITADARAPATETPEATVTPETTAEPTEEPTPEATDEPVAMAKPLVVEFVKPHYECVLVKMNDFGDQVCVKRFVVIMDVRNVSSSQTLRGGEFGWMPKRWVIDDGTNQRDGNIVQSAHYMDIGPYLVPRPDVPSGGDAEFTFMAGHLQDGEWVSAVDYIDEWGNEYRNEFPKPEDGDRFYTDCGNLNDEDC